MTGSTADEKRGVLRHAPAKLALCALMLAACAAARAQSAARIPGARKVTIPGASHHPPVETPKEFNRVLLNFLRSS